MDYKLYKCWLSKLESGEIRQTQYRFCINSQPPGYCCLGVLGEAAIELGYPIAKASKDDSSLISYHHKDTPQWDWSTGSFEPRALAALALSREEQDKLIVLNDEDARDFKFIAEWIRANIKVLS